MIQKTNNPFKYRCYCKENSKCRESRLAQWCETCNKMHDLHQYIYIFDEYLRWQVQKSICYPIDTALAHLLGYFLSKGDEANRVPVVCRNLNYNEEKNQSFDFCCNCDNDSDDDREDVNDRGDYSVLFTHSLEVPWRSWEETTTSDVEDLTERVQQREGYNIEIWEDEDKGHYQRDHPASDRATQPPHKSCLVAHLSA